MVDHRFGEEPLLAQRLHRGRSVALGQLPPVRPQYDGQMAELGWVPPEGLVQPDLLGGVGDVILGPKHMGDPHLVVIHHTGQVVGGGPVCLLDHEVPGGETTEAHLPTQKVAKGGLLGRLRHPEPDGWFSALRKIPLSLRLAEVAAMAIVLRDLAPG